LTTTPPITVATFFSVDGSFTAYAEIGTPDTRSARGSAESRPR
jgi:hypothetical protein